MEVPVHHASKPSAQVKREKRKWLMLMIAPLAALIIVAVAQFIAAFALNRVSGDGTSTVTSSSPIGMVINIISFVVGIVALFSLVLFPVWLIKYLNAGSLTRSKTTAIVLAVIFGFWTWVYTYEKDGTKFWVNFGLTVITFGYFGLISWIWSIIDASIKPDSFYADYGKNLEGLQ